MARSRERSCSSTTHGKIWPVLVTLLGLAIDLAFSGCGPSGVGSVDWADNPNARKIGYPPRLPQKPAAPRRAERRRNHRISCRADLPAPLIRPPRPCHRA
jgi:hypothetical protein